MASRFVVGIDLGTTHTVVAYSEIDPKRKGAPDPRIFEVAQLVTPREREALAMLPSCLYAPVAGEVEGDPDWVAGELARKRGAEVVGRFVASAKSWRRSCRGARRKRRRARRRGGSRRSMRARGSWPTSAKHGTGICPTHRSPSKTSC